MAWLCLVELCAAASHATVACVSRMHAAVRSVRMSQSERQAFASCSTSPHAVAVQAYGSMVWLANTTELQATMQSCCQLVFCMCLSFVCMGSSTRVRGCTSLASRCCTKDSVAVHPVIICLLHRNRLWRRAYRMATWSDIAGSLLLQVKQQAV